MSRNPEDLIRLIETRGTLALSDAERALLETAPHNHEQAQKILAADAFNSGDGARALIRAKRAYGVRQSVENTSNLVSALQRAGQTQAAIDLASHPDSPLDAIVQAGRVGELYARLGDTEQARAWGLKALSLKDAAVPRVAQAAPVLHAFDASQPGRNILSYSLWGDDPRYLDGAIRNAIVAGYLYPGWTARFYIDESVPKAAQRALIQNGAQLRKVPGLPAAQFGLFWRFLVEDDPEVRLYAVRDADSVVNIRERVMVQDWLNAATSFHVMRDWPSHSELLLAGMWGAHRGNLPDMGKRITEFGKERGHVLNDRAADQLFLRQRIWPLMRDRMTCHDAPFGYMATHELPAGYTLPGNMHVGQNDAVRQRKA